MCLSGICRGTAGMTDSCFSAAERSAEEIRSAKKTLRSAMLSLRRNLPDGFRRTADHAVNNALISFIRECGVRRLAGYLTDGTEPDLHETFSAFLAEGGSLFLPRYEQDGTYRLVRAGSLTSLPGKWGIPEPGPEAPDAAPEELKNALWLIPGVAFDSSFRRLGRGKGIYDRFLSGSAGPVIGVFYECQHAECIPCEEHDRPLDGTATERGLVFRDASAIKQTLCSMGHGKRRAAEHTEQAAFLSHKSYDKENT